MNPSLYTHFQQAGVFLPLDKSSVSWHVQTTESEDKKTTLYTLENITTEGTTTWSLESRQKLLFFFILPFK